MNTQTDFSAAAFDVAFLGNPPAQPARQWSAAETLRSGFDVSVVIPAMNEEESLPTLHERIQDVCERAQKRVEIIFIDDGSSDSTWDKMQDLSVRFPNTRAIRFRRNFGKAAALSAGFSIARGTVVITMDADLQDDPEEIPRFLAALSANEEKGTADQEGEDGTRATAGRAAVSARPLDVVSGWKKVRHDPWHKVLPSRVFNAMVSGMTGVKLHDHNCGFKAYRREVLSEVDLYGERHRFIPVLAAARGWNVGEIEVLHHPRMHGVSKYGLSRLGKGFLDLLSIYLLTGYARRPLHLIGSAGLACFAIGSIGLFVLSAAWVLTRIGSGEPLHLHSTAIFYYCILAMLLGAQCVLAGLIAELIVSVSAARDRSLRALQMRPSDSHPNDPAPPSPLQHGPFSVSQTAGFTGQSNTTSTNTTGKPSGDAGQGHP